MLNKVLLLFCAFLASIFLLGPGALAASQATDKIFQACQDAGGNPAACQAQDTTQNPVVKTINAVANGFAVVGGVVAVIMIIISGLKFVLGGGIAGGQRSGDPTAIKSARATLAAAIVGLIIIALAWSIVHFVVIKVIQ